jgi:hypothetical protein
MESWSSRIAREVERRWCEQELLMGERMRGDKFASSSFRVEMKKL